MGTIMSHLPPILKPCLRNIHFTGTLPSLSQMSQVAFFQEIPPQMLYVFPSQLHAQSRFLRVRTSWFRKFVESPQE